MPQVDPTLRPNSVRVIDCIEWCLKQINPANSTEDRPYYTDGVVVDRNRDPRKLMQDLAAQLKSIGSFCRIKRGDGKILSGKKGYVGDSYRTEAKIELICWSVLTDKQDAAGIVMDQVISWLQHDIEVALSNDDDGTTCIKRAAAGLAQEEGPWGAPGTWGSAPSCIDLRFDGWLAGGVANFPWQMEIMELSYLSDAHGSGRVPGAPL